MIYEELENSSDNLKNKGFGLFLAKLFNKKDRSKEIEELKSAKDRAKKALAEVDIIISAHKERNE
jgi:hypothetical protein